MDEILAKSSTSFLFVDSKFFVNCHSTFSIISLLGFLSLHFLH